jgi:Lar family restriction alleviation protein
VGGDVTVTQKPRFVPLRPCPFCGVPPRTYRRSDESLWSRNFVEWLTIKCDVCDVQMASEDQDGVIDQWNTRKKPKSG